MKTSQKLLIVPVIAVLVLAAVFFGTRTGGSEGNLSEAVEAGELTLTSVGRNYQSVTKFVQNDQGQAKQLLEAARVALEDARAKMASAAHTKDGYVQGMLGNYQRVAQASDTMAKGVDNLLTINENLTEAFEFYSKGEFDKAAQQALYSLQMLTPLVGEFETSASALNGIDVSYIPSGQKDRLTLSVAYYRSERDTYRQCILLLQTLLQGKDYLQKNAELEEYMRRLQQATANKDYATAEMIRQQMSSLLESLKDPSYQNAADLASQLKPEMLDGEYSKLAQELKNRLRNTEGLDAFKNYLQALQKYMQAQQTFEQNPNNPGIIQPLIDDALNNLGQGAGAGDGELQGLDDALRGALNELSAQLYAKSPPPSG